MGNYYMYFGRKIIKNIDLEASAINFKGCIFPFKLIKDKNDDFFMGKINKMNVSVFELFNIYSIKKKKIRIQ